jgi:predicted nucleic acid-binding Zn ribbon protein
MLRSYGLGPKLDEVKLIKVWEEVVGPMIAKHSRNIYFREGTLHVELDSAPLKQELSFAKSKLTEKLNEKMGRNLVQNIVIK